MPVLLGLTAFAVDVSQWSSTKNSIQAAADNSVLSAVMAAAQAGASLTQIQNQALAVAAATGFTNGQGGVTVTVNNPPASDLALAIWANQQVGNAARAGTEYAAINCWNSSTSGISATCATNVSTAATSATPRSVTATPSNYCGCDIAGGASGASTQACGSTCPDGSKAGTYVSVTASTSYTPIFPAVWGTLLTSGSLSMSATSVTRIN